MTTFALISEKDNDALFQRVQAVYPGDESIKIDKTIVLIHSETEGLAKQVCEKIEGPEKSVCKMGDFGRVVVFSITSYNGWHFKSMWDWLSAKGV